MHVCTSMKQGDRKSVSIYHLGQNFAAEGEGGRPYEEEPGTSLQ